MPGIKSPERPRQKAGEEGRDLTLKERKSRASFMIDTAEQEAAFELSEAKQGEVWDNALFELESNPEMDVNEALDQGALAVDVKAIPASIRERLASQLEKAQKIQQKIMKQEDMLATSLTSRKRGDTDGQLTPDGEKMAEEMVAAYKKKLKKMKPGYVEKEEEKE